MRAKLSADGKRLIADGHHLIATFERANECATLAESVNRLDALEAENSRLRAEGAEDDAAIARLTEQWQSATEHARVAREQTDAYCALGSKKLDEANDRWIVEVNRLNRIIAKTISADFRSALSVVLGAALNEATNCHATGRELGNPDGLDALKNALHIRSAIDLVRETLNADTEDACSEDPDGLHHVGCE